MLDRRRPLDEALETFGAGASRRDRAFVVHLASTVLRRLGQLDELIGRCLERPLPPRLLHVQHMLRLGAAQLLFLRTSPHAAVHTTAALARTLRGAEQVGLINAVLRRLAAEGPALLQGQDAARLNTPEWLWQSWLSAYGEATTRGIAEAHLAEPPLDLTPRSADAAGSLAASLSAALLPTGSVRLTHAGPVAALPGYAEGAWWVQDAAAALPARLLGEVAGRTVVDLCAAPGGKTAQLAAAGARVIAVDRSGKRLARLQANLDRLRLACETVEADAAAWRPPAPVDAVLLDVPCSATGTIRRHPDVARLKSPAEVAALAAVQRRLLSAAVEMLRPGGVLVYCACSLQPEEGAAVVDSLAAKGGPLQRLAIRPREIGGCAELLTPAGDLRTLPCHWAGQGGLDGFYAARLRKR